MRTDSKNLINCPLELSNNIAFLEAGQGWSLVNIFLLTSTKRQSVTTQVPHVLCTEPLKQTMIERPSQRQTVAILAGDCV